MPSSFFHGVTVTLIDDGPRTIGIPSTSIIGLVDTFIPGEDFAEPDTAILLTSYREAVKQFGPGSDIAKAARGIFAQSSATIVAVGIDKKISESCDDGNADGEGENPPSKPDPLTTAIIGGETVEGHRTGMQALLNGKPLYNTQPRLIVCPGHSAREAVAAAMATLAEKLRAIAIVDGPNKDDESAIKYFKDFGNKRIYAVDPWVKVWDDDENGPAIVPASPYVAGLIAKVDRERGFWNSPSNKPFNDVIGTGRPVEFIDGDENCRANLLNAAHITTVIRDGGYILWGNRTLSVEPKWSFITRVRTVDMVMDAILFGHKWAVDRGITKTYIKDVTEGLRAFMRDMRAQGAVINFDVFEDRELNSPSQIEEGRVYWTIRFTDVPPAENPNFRIEVTNEWLRELISV